jgi:hypothetical protein
VNGDFDLFKSLCQKSTIWVTEANRRLLISLSRQVRDSDLSASFLNLFDTYSPPSQIYDHFGESMIPFLASEFQTEVVCF